MSMTRQQAERELVKVAISFKALEAGLISTMDESNLEKFMEWLE